MKSHRALFKDIKWPQRDSKRLRMTESVSRLSVCWGSPFQNLSMADRGKLFSCHQTHSYSELQCHAESPCDEKGAAWTTWSHHSISCSCSCLSEDTRPTDCDWTCQAWRQRPTLCKNSSMGAQTLVWSWSWPIWHDPSEGTTNLITILIYGVQ